MTYVNSCATIKQRTIYTQKIEKFKIKTMNKQGKMLITWKIHVTI